MVASDNHEASLENDADRIHELILGLAATLESNAIINKALIELGQAYAEATKHWNSFAEVQASELRRLTLEIEQVQDAKRLELSALETRIHLLEKALTS